METLNAQKEDFFKIVLKLRSGYGRVTDCFRVEMWTKLASVYCGCRYANLLTRTVGY